MNTPTQAPAGSAALNNPATQALGWAVQRLATIQGSSAERLRLQQALAAVQAAGGEASAQAEQLAQRMGWPQVQTLAQPDEARLPLLCWQAQRGWAVVVSRTAEGAWAIETERGRQTLASAELGTLLRLVAPPHVAASETATAVVRRTFKQYRGTVSEGALASVLINVVALATSFFSMQVYDRVIPTQGYYTLMVLALGVGLSILFEFAIKVARSRLLEYAVVGFDSGLARDIFQRLLSIRLDQMPASVGSLSAQLRAYESIRGFMTASTLYLLVDVPFAIVFVLVIGLLGGPYVALVPLVFFALALSAGLMLRNKINALALAGAKAGNEKTGLLVEAVEGAETIKAGQGGWRFLSRWLDLNNEAMGYDLRMRYLSEMAGFLTGFLQQTSYAAMVAVGAWQVIEGNMTMGALIACSIISGRALAPAGMLPGLLVQAAHAKAALDGLEKVYKLEPDNAGVRQPLLPTRVQGNYNFEAVRHAYQAAAAPPGSQPLVVLNVPQLEIKAGEKVGVLGPVGSGKSTLLRLLSGMHRPAEGRILLDGLDLSHIARQRLSEQIGYLQQDHRLFQGSLRENLLIGLPDPGDEAIQNAARRSGLAALIAGHPQGLGLQIAEGGKGLSGGQRQLVAFTRLLLTEPRIWLLDEPTANMDEELERRCLGALRQTMTPEHTLVLVTHKPALLPLVDRLIVVAQHRVVLAGPRDEVLRRLSAPPPTAATTVVATPGGST